MIAWTRNGPVVGGREITISKGSLTETDTSQEGFAIAYCELTLGEEGKEQSWGVTNLLEMTVGWRALSVCSSQLTHNLIVPDPGLNTLSRRRGQFCANI
jgi:hypothetical protein